MMKKSVLLILAALLTVALLVGCTASPEVTPAVPEAAAPTPAETEPDAEDPIAEPAQTAPAGQAASPYDAILAQYTEAVQNNYYLDVDEEARDAAFGPDVALEWRINPQHAFYTLADLDGNGSEELVIGAGEGEYIANYDIFTSDGGAAVRLFDMDFGYRTNFNVYADGVIEVSWSSSAFESGFDFYRVNGAAAELVTSLWTTVNEEQPETLIYMQDDTVISEEEYTELLAQQQSAGKLAFNWQQLA